jgi:acyl-CoA synthetase (AMP-forming)/AMP-acid ligase II
MNILVLLEMAASGSDGRVAFQDDGHKLTAEELLELANRAPATFGGHDIVAFVGTNSVALPVSLFGAAATGIPFVPLNYRLPQAQLIELLGRHDHPIVVAKGPIAEALAAAGIDVVDPESLLGPGALDQVEATPADGDDTALLLYTSGTTAAPKAAVLRHRHLTSYVIGSVEYGSADEDSANLVSVPPYHIAGVANLLSNLYMGRRVVYLEQFDPQRWVDLVVEHKVTNAMVVPTMLTRICDHLEESGTAITSLRALSYGGSRTPVTVIERVMQQLPGVDLTNAYGLTETSSTIAVLGPDDHRDAMASEQPHVRARLSSAGRILPTIEVEVRGEDGAATGVGEPGEIWVRGEQVSGEYVGLATSHDPDGWFPTRDRGWLDDDGFLFIEGRSDDTIIRGGENIAPAEIEEVLLVHPDIAECAVVGVPDDEWGQRIAAVVVAHPGHNIDPDELRTFVRERLRGSKTPDVIRVVDELPYTETGKLLRRVVLEQLATE